MGGPLRNDCAAAPACSYAEEIQNFANWFSYYRKRELVAKAADNHAMLLAREPLGELLFPAFGTVIRNIGPGERLFEAHTKIFQALKKGNEKQAETWMAKHIRDFRRGCELAGLNLDSPVSTKA